MMNEQAKRAIAQLLAEAASDPEWDEVAVRRSPSGKDQTLRVDVVFNCAMGLVPYYVGILVEQIAKDADLAFDDALQVVKAYHGLAEEISSTKNIE